MQAFSPEGKGTKMKREEEKERREARAVFDRLLLYAVVHRGNYKYQAPGALLSRLTPEERGKLSKMRPEWLEMRPL